MKVLRLAICAALAAGTLAVAAPGAAAQDCTPKGGSDRPYQGQGEVIEASGWFVQADPDNGVVGWYWSDGYVFADATPDRVTVRTHVPYYPGWVQARVTVYSDGREPVVCQDFKEP